MLKKIAVGAYCALLVSALGGTVAHASAKAADYPSGPIRLVVPFPPGGSVDQIGRLLSQKLAEKTGKPVVVENRPGGSTMIGTQSVVKAQPDGLTLLVAVSSAATNPAMFKDMPYDLQKDLASVSLLAIVPTVLYTNLDFPAKNIQDLLKIAETRAVNIGTAGYGTMAGLTTELFRDMTKTKTVHVPYNGGAPAMTDAMAGHTQALWGTAVQAYEQYKAKRLGAIGITGEVRHPLYPDVPTFKEQGIDLVTNEWYALLAPAGTPRPVIDKLNGLIKDIFESKDFGKGHEMFAFQHSTPEGLDKFIAEETRRWGDLIRRLGIKAN